MYNWGVQTKQYVCYNKQTGELFSVGPSKEEGYDYIEVTDEQVEPIKSYETKMEDYRVVLNSVTKVFELRRLTEVDTNKFALNKLLNIKEDPYYDVVFKVDKNKGLCYINTVETLSTASLDKQIMFSITKRDDPHQLFETIEYTLGTNIELEVPFTSTYSVYTDSDIIRCVYEEI